MSPKYLAAAAVKNVLVFVSGITTPLDIIILGEGPIPDSDLTRGFSTSAKEAPAKVAGAK